MAEYSKMAHGIFTTTTSVSGAVYLPFEPDFVQMWNLTASKTPTNAQVAWSMWNKFMPQGEGISEVYEINNVLTTQSDYPTGITSFSAALSLQFQAPIQISGMTIASSCIVTTAAVHSYGTGDIVVFQGLYETATTGMAQICGIPFVITVLSSTTFSIPWNTNQSNYIALTGSPTGAFVKKITYPFLYSPGVAYIQALTLGTTTVVNCTAPTNFVVGQEIAFRIPSLYGTTQLNPNQNQLIPGSPVYGVITQINNAQNFTCNINSSNFTPFSSNVPISAVPGLSFAQVLAIGDLNTGGVQYSGNNLYPSPVVNGFSTINGPAISGSFVNNSRNGFIFGANAGLNGVAGQKIYWQAYSHDYNNGVAIPIL